MNRQSLNAIREDGIKSIEVGCRLLEALAAAKRPLALSELARAGAMSTSKAHRYLTSFQRSSLVLQDEHTRRYALGSLASRLGAAMIGQANPREQMRDAQRALRDRIKHTVVMSTWTNAGPVVYATEDGLSALVATMRAGSPLPLVSTAAGRVFSAFMPWPTIRPLAMAELSLTVTSEEGAAIHLAEVEFEHLLAKVRTRGLESCRGSMLRRINAVAAPFLNTQSELIGVMAIIGDADQLDVTEGAPAALALREMSLQFQGSAP